VLCQYYSNDQKNILLSKTTKEFPIASELIDFENDLIRFEEININDGIIYFFFVINEVVMQETNTDVPTYNRLILNEVGIRKEPIDLSFLVGNYTKFKISIKITNKNNIEEDKNNNLNSEVINNNKLNENQKETKTNSDINIDIKMKLKLEKNYTAPLAEVNKKLEKNSEIENNEYYLKGIPYDKYLSQLKSENKKEYETGRETFCEGFFIASFPQKNGHVIENSQSFPAPCGHKECGSLPSMKPEIIERYPLENTSNLELNNLAATICFPTGIKVCYSEEDPSTIKDYVTPIINAKGDRYYMVTYHFYYKIMNDVYSKLYEMHPLKHHLMKFADSYLGLSNEEMNESIMNEIQKSLEQSQELGFRDYVYIPYCICLISKYPYIIEMKKCLQSIYTMTINNLKEDNLDLNNLIMYLIHSVPIPKSRTKVKFFIPYFNKSIKLICPKIHDIKVINRNISNLLKFFDIDNILIIYRLILFEKKILFIDDDYTRLSLVTDNFISLLYPFHWIHTYIPIMSIQMLQYLEAFLPFVNGINISLMPLVTKIFEEQNENNEEVFLIYINENKIKLGSSLINNNKKINKYLQDHVPNLPIQMEKDLKNKLKKIKDELERLLKNNKKNKNFDLAEFDFDLRIRNIFIEMFVQMFHDSHKYMTILDDDVVFNKSLFLEKITNTYDKKFYNEFLDTQLFQQFCQNIVVKNELKYFLKMLKNYDPNKREKNPFSLSLSLSSPISSLTLNRTITNKINQDKIYIIKPDYLKISDEIIEDIETKMIKRYTLDEKVDEDGMIISEDRILLEIGKIKKENYHNNNCYIYIIPEIKKNKNENPIDKFKSKELTSQNLLYAALFQKLKTNKNFLRRNEKKQDAIKETIKDFTMNIFTSKEIKNEPNLQKNLQNSLNTSIGRQFFVNILSNNLTNINLLEEKSFQLLGTLIFNSLLFILNIQETDILLEQMVILIKSTKYFGKEIKGKTTTLWKEYKSKIQGYSKVNQNNFWEKWYEIEIKKDDKISQKKKIFFKLLKYMIELELDRSFIKNVIQGLVEKEFGNDPEELSNTNNEILEKIKKAKYSKSTKK